MNQKPFPEQLRDFRARRNLSQSKAAARLRVPVRTFQHWEQGVYEPSDPLKMEYLQRKIK